MHKLFTATITIALLTVLLCASLGSAASFPFNGSLELISSGKPVGWQSTGMWFIRPDAACDGRNGISVFGDFGKKGSQLVTSGYLLVNDEPVKLSLTYQCLSGSMSIGLIFCDKLGNPIAEGAWEALPERPVRDLYQREIILPKWLELPVGEAPADAVAEPAPAAEPAAAAGTGDAPVDGVEPIAPPAPPVPLVGYASVRLALRIDQDGTQVRFDDIKLTHGGPMGKSLKAPVMKAELRPNLLTAGDFSSGLDGLPQCWQPLVDDGHAAELATFMAAPEPQANHLALQGAPEKAAAWVGEPVLLDGAMPYSLEADLDTTGLAESRLRMLVQLIDPQDEKAVWMQQEQEVSCGEDGLLAMALPRLWNDPAAVRAQVALELPAGSEGQAVVRKLALRPEPLSVSVRGVAGGFKRPADVQLFVSAANNTFAVLKPKAVLQLCDENGRTVASETRPIVIGSRSAAYFPYKPKVACAGEYTLTVTIINGSMKLGQSRYTFLVDDLPRVSQTP